MFIAIEGIDGCGKSTQIELLAKKLNAVTFHFPDYTTPIGQLILSHLKEEWKADSDALVRPSLAPQHREDLKYVDSLVFQALQFANRLEKSEDVSDALRAGHVIADRYIASGIVYGSADGLEQTYLEKTQRLLKQPDVNILLDITAEESYKRRPGRRDRYEKQSGFLDVVSRLYRDLWARKQQENANNKHAPKWVTIEGTQSVERIHLDILSFCPVA